MKTEWIDIAAPDGGTFGGYLAAPEGRPGPGVVLIQEIFGVNNAMRDKANHFAAQGYPALVPDLFWRLEPRLDLGYSEAEFARAREFLGRFDVDAGVGDIGAAVAAMRALPSCSGKVAVIGFCLGGRMAYLSAARLEVDAAVSYYGGRTHEYLDEATNVRSPILFHFGEEDGSIPPDQVAKIRDAFAGRRDAEFHVYPGAGHAFSNHDRNSYHEPSAELAENRTMSFLESVFAD